MLEKLSIVPLSEESSGIGVGVQDGKNQFYKTTWTFRNESAGQLGLEGLTDRSSDSARSHKANTRRMQV